MGWRLLLSFPSLLVALCCPVEARAANDAVPTLGEVTVTARRVSEDARTLPLAVDVVSGSALGAGRVDGLQSLAARVPGLDFESFWGGRSASPVIRGLAQPSTAADNVGVFVDDLYQAGRSSLDFNPVDIERIEVLRGPQNTQFGRSTFAGAIRYVTHRPSEHRVLALDVDAGSDGLSGAGGTVSGPLGDSRWLGRAAYGYRKAGGTVPVNGATDADALRSESLALGIDRTAADDSERPVQVTARLTRSTFGHPASSTVDHQDYNCGAANALSGIWSYYCGPLPIARDLALTRGIPRSTSHSSQVAVQLNLRAGNLMLRSLTGAYQSASDSFRDFDGSDQGFRSGVCTAGVSCPADSTGAAVTRFSSPDVVSRADVNVVDWSQEFRLEGGTPGPLQWMIGLSAHRARIHDRSLFGADQADLLPNERLTAILVGTPFRVGPLSQLNYALVPDSRMSQRLQAESIRNEASLSAFGALDWAFVPQSRLRAEVRVARDRLELDSRVAGYQPDTGADPEPVEFTALTPRLSIDWQPGEQWYGYASLARGARSGGFNTNAGLAPGERSYDPETNWTSELGVRYSGIGLIHGWQATVYYVDWRDTQIMGLATTPGVNTLVVANTAGLTVPGVEAAFDLRPASWLRVHLAWSHTDPAFRRGSDDAGSRAYCGLTTQPAGSDFCAYGPPRFGATGPIALVPFLDGNAPGRAARNSGNALLEATPRWAPAGWHIGTQIEWSYKDDVFDRGINGARYGERQLLGMRLSVWRGPWRVTAWGTNLTEERYVRAVSSRGGAFYPSLPRPLDLLMGEGRRIGLSVGFSLDPGP